jgi:hypothetical protein
MAKRLTTDYWVDSETGVPSAEDIEVVLASDYDALAAHLVEVLEAIGDPYNELDHAVLDRLLRDLGPDFCDTTRWWARLSAKKSDTPPA